jgi:hypothetical protein
MKIKFIVLFALFLAFSFSSHAQDSSSSKKILYKYTFEGMKDSSEIAKLNDAVKQLKDVVWADVIFKSSSHKYAQLKVEVMVPDKIDESSPDVTGPSDLKKILSKFGYTPAECNTYHEN